MTQQTNPQSSEELPQMKNYHYPSSFRWGAGSDIIVASDELRKYINQEVQKALSMVEVPMKFTMQQALKDGGTPRAMGRNEVIDQVVANIVKIKEMYDIQKKK